MARRIGAGVVEVFWVTTIADYTAPTSTELNAGVDLTGFVRDGSPATPNTGQTADTADQGSPFNKTQAGTYGGDQASLECYRDDAADTAFTTLAIRTEGFLVVSRFGLATPGTFAIADRVDVYPATIINQNPAPVGRNEAQRFTAEMAITDDPALDFPLAA